MPLRLDPNHPVALECKKARNEYRTLAKEIQSRERRGSAVPPEDYALLTEKRLAVGEAMAARGRYLKSVE